MKNENGSGSVLERKLGLLTCISIVVGAVIGSSIFMKPASMAAQLGSPLLLLLVWVVGGTVSLFGGMINAEVGTLIPQTGGQYIYFRKMYGNFFAYLYGWAGFIVINTASIAGISFIFAQYAGYYIELPGFSREIEQSFVMEVPLIGTFYPLRDMGVKVMAICLVALLTLLNTLSLKAAGTAQVFLTALKVSALLFMSVLIFTSGKGDIENLTTASLNFEASFIPAFTAFIAATTGALAAYDGWNNLGFLAGEIKNPAKNIPRGMIVGIAICMFLYIATTEAYLYMLPVEVMKDSKLVASEALCGAMGIGGGGFIALLVVVSTAGSVNGNIMPCARVSYAMGQERQFFLFAGRVNRKFHTPANALFLQGVWAGVLIILGSFDMLMDMFVFITWIFYGFAAYGIFILRRTMPLADRPYKLKWYPFIPIIFISFTILYVVITLYSDINNFREGKTAIINSVFGLMLTLAGVPLYFIFRRQKT